MNFFKILLTSISIIIINFSSSILCNFPVSENSNTPNNASSYEVVFSWKQLDYEFPPKQAQEEEFILQNNVITGIKVHPASNRLFLTVPRWRPGVPATLTYVDLLLNSTDLSPKLKAYPSWELQQLNNCSALQYVQSMELDTYNRLWIIDIGRIDIFNPNTTYEPICPPKLVFINLFTDEVVHVYNFPPEVVSPTSNFMNDLVVACVSEGDCAVYISDAMDAKIIYYDYAKDESWSFKHWSMEVTDANATNLTINGIEYTVNTPIDGIAISSLSSSNYSTLYYTPLSSFELYSISTERLRNLTTSSTSNHVIELNDTDITNIGFKGSQSDGLAMSSNNVLYYGLLGQNSINYWNTSANTNTTTMKANIDEQLLVQDDEELQWIDTFSFDNNGYLYATANKLQRFITDTYDFNVTNFRVVRAWIGQKSYMY